MAFEQDSDFVPDITNWNLAYVGACSTRINGESWAVRVPGRAEIVYARMCALLDIGLLDSFAHSSLLGVSLLAQPAAHLCGPSTRLSCWTPCL